jgi:hypothetical protein
VLKFKCQIPVPKVKQEEESFNQQIGLEFEEEASKMLHLEHGSGWC